jgi:hypothetical protein
VSSRSAKLSPSLSSSGQPSSSSKPSKSSDSVGHLSTASARWSLSLSSSGQPLPSSKPSRSSGTFGQSSRLLATPSPSLSRVSGAQPIEAKMRTSGEPMPRTTPAPPPADHRHRAGGLDAQAALDLHRAGVEIEALEPGAAEQLADHREPLGGADGAGQAPGELLADRAGVDRARLAEHQAEVGAGREPAAGRGPLTDEAAAQGSADRRR